MSGIIIEKMKGMESRDRKRGGKEWGEIEKRGRGERDTRGRDGGRVEVEMSDTEMWGT